MSKTVDELVVDAIYILQELGIPLTTRTNRQNEKTAKSFLAVADVRPGHEWEAARSILNGHKLLSREIIRYLNANLNENISEGSYDDIRREALLLPVEGEVVMKSAANPSANTNDGTRGYAISQDMAILLHTFGTSQWGAALGRFNSQHTLLIDKLNRSREMSMIPVTIPNGNTINFSPGEHNEIQRDIIHEFLPRFGYESELLYVGDTSNKSLYVAVDRLHDLGIPEPSHDELPDVIAYSPSKNWLFLIEAVHSANPITEIRKLKLQKMLENCSAYFVFVTAFQNKNSFRKFSSEIAWETEVWISEDPSHMIHFNGDKFVGPYSI